MPIGTSDGQSYQDQFDLSLGRPITQEGTSQSDSKPPVGASTEVTGAFKSNLGSEVAPNNTLTVGDHLRAIREYVLGSKQPTAEDLESGAASPPPLKDDILKSINYAMAAMPPGKVGINTDFYWTGSELKEMKDLMSQGWTASDVARSFEVTPAAIQQLLKRQGLQQLNPRAAANSAWAKQETQDSFKDLWEKNVSIRDIATQLKMTPGQIAGYAARNGFTRKGIPPLPIDE